MSTETISNNDLVINENTNQIIVNQKDVYNAGVKSEYDRFWESYQQNGNRVNGSYMFAHWDKDLIKPKYDLIVTTSAEGMFYYCTIEGDLEEFFSKQGITLDLSKLNNASCAIKSLRGCYYVTKAGVLNFSTATQMTETFYGCRALETIDKIIVSDKTVVYGATVFTSCEKLANLTVEGTIVRSFNISPCPLLTYDSAVSIINALKKNKGTSDEGKYTVTFNSSVWTTLNAGQKPEGYSTWQDYVTMGLGWSC